MVVLYVCVDSLQETVNYFKKTQIDSPEQLGMFFFFKSIGFDEKTYHAFPKVSGISDEDRRDYLKMYIIYQLFMIMIMKMEIRNVVCFHLQ